MRGSKGIAAALVIDQSWVKPSGLFSTRSLSIETEVRLWLLYCEQPKFIWSMMVKLSSNQKVEIVRIIIINTKYRTDAHQTDKEKK